MCTKVTCQTCGRPTWRGCGLHIEEALHDVPVEERCDCPRPDGAGQGVWFGSW